MDNVKRKDNYVSYIVEDHKEYLNFIKLVLNNTDVVCFKVSPFLDNLEEFKHSIWSYLSDNVLYTTCDVEISDGSGNISHLLFLKNDYTLYDTRVKTLLSQMLLLNCTKNQGITYLYKWILRQKMDIYCAI